MMKNPESGKVKVNDINVHYEIHGKGEPLLLIQGLGYSSWMWFKQIPDFSREYKVIVFDNRGVGDSDKPDIEYTIEKMADDATGLLKAVGIKSAHVLGASMGGFIAQQMAINYPDMVKSLALVSTSFSGRDVMHVGASSLFSTFAGFWGCIPAMLDFSGKGNAPIVNSFGLTPEKKIRYGLSLALSPEYLNSHMEEIDRIVEWRLAHPQPLYAWKRQLMAGMKFDASDSVCQIMAPTLVVTGSADKVVPPESSKRLAEKIPNSRLVEIQGTGHLPFIETADDFNQLVLGFLDKAGKEPQLERKEWWRRIVRFFSYSIS
jgi:pimeloyl-ACP methyl ester carboxylesterase